jgi:transcriptional regulator with XRE-family HTH domain
MSYGYSQNLIQANKSASVKLPGVALGRACISAGISVNDVAEYFGVSRMTVYNWFKGDSSPVKNLVEPIQRYTHLVKQYNRV